MKKVLPVVALFSFLFAVIVTQFIAANYSAQTQIAAPTSIEEAFKTAIVLDGDGDGLGSCFPIAKKFGCVALISCKHVIVDPTPVAVLLPNGDVAPIISMVANLDVDIAVIWIRANPHLSIAPLQLSDTPPSPGTQAILAGYPISQDLWISQGLVPRRSIRGDGWWTSIPIYYGCSGGPVIADGRVIGVASGIMVDRNREQSVSSISYVITIDSFREWLRVVLTHDPMMVGK